jgi:hypothetical protein
LPLAVIAASANDNEKRHAPTLFLKAWKATEHRVKAFIADSQYSSRKLRELLSAYGVKAVIPYPAKQNGKEADLLRVDWCFRTHGPAEEKQVYTLRSAAERMNSRQKEQLCLEKHRARGLKRIAVHALKAHVSSVEGVLKTTHSTKRVTVTFQPEPWLKGELQTRVLIRVNTSVSSC